MAPWWAAASSPVWNHTPAICSPDAPCLGLGGAEAHDGPALGPHQILGRDPHRPTQPRGLADDLIEGMHGLGPAYALDGLHLLAALEELHGEDDRAQLQPLFELADQGRPVLGHEFLPPPGRRERIGVQKSVTAKLLQFMTHIVMAEPHAGAERCSPRHDDTIQGYGANGGPIAVTVPREGRARLRRGHLRRWRPGAIGR